MSAQTLIYYFNQRQQVVLLDSGSAISNRRYTVVYAKELTVSKGCDNLLQFAFVNNEQKPVNLDGRSVMARIISGDGSTVIVQRELVGIYPITGLMSLTLTADDLADHDAERSYYTMVVSDDLGDYPAFMDSGGTFRGILNIVNGVQPAVLPSSTLSVPSHSTPVYWSSIISAGSTSDLTIQATLESFTGSIDIQGSTLSTFSQPYTIEYGDGLTDFSGSIGYTIEGFHPYVRLQMSSTVGSVTNITYR